MLCGYSYGNLFIAAHLGIESLFHNADYATTMQGVIALRIGICEPDHDYLAYLSRLLNQIHSIYRATVIPYINPNWLVSDLSLRIEAFDILIINRDIEGYNGAYVAREAVRINPSCQVVLISNQNCVMDEDYEIAQHTLLPKEHVPLRLVTVIDRAVKIIHQRNERYFFVQANREKLLIPCSSVLYMEKMLRKTELVTLDKRISTYQIPSDLLESSKAENFVQCHRSYYVNLENIYSLGTTEIVLNNGDRLPIGKTFSQKITEQFERYCSCLLCSI